jgi:ATP-dependent Clp protease ATP-binding subunit ClpA
VITIRIEDQLSEHLLRGKIARGDTVVVDINREGGFTFHEKACRKDTA